MSEPARTPGEWGRVVRFLAMGVVNVAINYAIFALLILAGTAPAIALAAGTVVSVAVNYGVGGRLVFGNRGLARVPHFLGAYALTYGVNVLGLRGLAQIGVEPLLGQLLMIPPVVALTYLLLRLFVFRAPRS